MSLQPLHQIVRVHHCLRDVAQDVRILLHLMVQIARQISQIVERPANILNHCSQIRVHIHHGRVGVPQRRFELHCDVRGQNPFAQRPRMIQMSRRRVEIRRQQPRADGDLVQIRSQVGAVRQHGRELIGQV